MAWRSHGRRVQALAVQVIVLVNPPASLEDTPLRETLSAMLAAPVARRVLALGGPGEDWLPAGFELMGQRGGDYGERLAAALADAYATAALPMLLIRADALEITRGRARGRRAVADLRRGGRRLRPGVRRRVLAARPAPARPVTGRRPPGAGRAAPARAACCCNRLASAGLRVALAPRLEIAGAALRF